MSVHQCATCQHWQRRGGVILPASVGCVALESEAAGPRLAAIVIAMARQLAARNQCPAFSPWPLQPDAYRAEDLPQREAPAHPIRTD